MKHSNYHLIIWSAVFVLLSIAALVVVSPGYWEYQQIRWRTQITPERIEVGMTAMLAATKATEEALGHRELTTADFDMVSAETLRAFQKISEYNDLAMVIRFDYLTRLRNDPSGIELKKKLSKDVADDVIKRIDDNSNLTEGLRVGVYGISITDPEFKEILLERIGSMDALRLSEEQTLSIEEGEQAVRGNAEPATR